MPGEGIATGLFPNVMKASAEQAGELSRAEGENGFACSKALTAGAVGVKGSPPAAGGVILGSFFIISGDFGLLPLSNCLHRGLLCSSTFLGGSALWWSDSRWV